MTNADKYFRNATDEEIARIIVDDWCKLMNCNCRNGKCEERVLNWLKQEVKDGQNNG